MSFLRALSSPARTLMQGYSRHKLSKFNTKASRPLFAPISPQSTARENIASERPTPAYHLSTSLHPHFDKDLRDVHLHYRYAGHDPDDEPWSYETWFQSEGLVVYEIHGGPMKGRKNYQRPLYQCIRPGEIWQISWLEETGTIVTMVYDIPQGTIKSMVAFSKGHWEHPDQAQGDKRNPHDFDRWRGLADIGHTMERFLFVKSAKIDRKHRGKGEIAPVEEGGVTL